MTNSSQKEAFDLNVIEKLGPLAIEGGTISIYDAAKMFWQARGEYEQERVKKLVESATKLCDEMDRPGYMNAKLDAVRDLRAELVSFINPPQGSQSDE